MAEKRNSRGRILHIAAEKFARFGFYKTTIEEIARNAHISKGLIYHYFPNKEDLYMAFIEQEAAKIFQEADEVLSGVKSATKKLALYVDIKVKWMEQMFIFKELEELEFWFDTEEMRSRMRKLMEQEQVLIQGILKEGIAQKKMKSGHVKQHSLILSTITDPVYWSKQLNFHSRIGVPVPEPDVMIKTCLNAFLDGICTTGAC